ncbi:hypothetical protein ABW19_dt0200775 [Dactylella cylindrospora]|nr:hypothetical protein ABW19_dt0200775 [Dactylella cylindrospora]
MVFTNVHLRLNPFNPTDLMEIPRLQRGPVYLRHLITGQILHFRKIYLLYTQTKQHPPSGVKIKERAVQIRAPQNNLLVAPETLNLLKMHAGKCHAATKQRRHQRKLAEGGLLRSLKSIFARIVESAKDINGSILSTFLRHTEYMHTSARNAERCLKEMTTLNIMCRGAVTHHANLESR